MRTRRTFASLRNVSSISWKLVALATPCGSSSRFLKARGLPLLLLTQRPAFNHPSPLAISPETASPWMTTAHSKTSSVSMKISSNPSWTNCPARRQSASTAGHTTFSRPSVPATMQRSSGPTLLNSSTFSSRAHSTTQRNGPLTASSHSSSQTDHFAPS
jgi:hypothetical protein